MTDVPPPQDHTHDFWEDRDSTRKLAPIYSNRAFVEKLGDGMLRISFGQITDEGVNYYTSIVLTAQNAVLVGDLLARQGKALLPPPLIFTPPPAPSPLTGGEHGNG